MDTRKTYKNRTGKEWLNLIDENDSITEVDGEMIQIVPCRLVASNRSEVCATDDATHVAVRSQWMEYAVHVEI